MVKKLGVKNNFTQNFGEVPEAKKVKFITKHF